MKQPIMNSEHISWPSPAKLNLFLHIIGQREDGYHNLQSVFQLLDYSDTLDIKVNNSGTISFNCSNQSLNQNNLVVAAANKLQNYAAKYLNRHNLGAEIFLHKRLPIGGGVGGGSSNCATALVALNQQWELCLSPEALSDIGLSLGADVPIFVMGNTAFVEGVGEILTPFDMPEVWYLVVQPPCQISTAEIFSNPLLTRNSKAITIRGLKAMDLPNGGINCMQEIVFSIYPEVKEVFDWLSIHCKNVKMTGTGSCLFATFDNQQKMRKIATRCKWLHFEARGVNKSPLIIRKPS